MAFQALQAVSPLDSELDLFAGPMDPSDAAEAELVEGRRRIEDEYDELDAEAIAEFNLPGSFR
jgi:hypothetical protein